MDKIKGRTVSEKNISGMFLLKCLLFSYILTAALLLLLALLLYKMQLTEAVVSIAIIAIYIVATFFAGFITGKKMQRKKYLWGLMIGGAYFFVLALISLAINQSMGLQGNDFLTTLILCAGGGMLGGMVS